MEISSLFQLVTLERVVDVSAIIIVVLLLVVLRLHKRVRTIENLPSVRDHLKYAKKNKK